MYVARLSFCYKAVSVCIIQPIAYFCLLLLQVRVDLKEVCDLFQQVWWNIIEPTYPAPLGIADGHAQDLLFRSFFVPHLKGGHRLHPNEAAREGCFTDKDKRIKCVSIFGQRFRDEAIIRGIMDRG